MMAARLAACAAAMVFLVGVSLASGCADPQQCCTIQLGSSDGPYGVFAAPWQSGQRGSDKQAVHVLLPTAPPTHQQPRSATSTESHSHGAEAPTPRYWRPDILVPKVSN
jgi:hypothetical protein